MSGTIAPQLLVASPSDRLATRSRVTLYEPPGYDVALMIHDTEPAPAPGSSSVYGLYVHIPFCETKCGYCDFFSVALQGRDVTPLLARIEDEIVARAAATDAKPLTVFCGGGTPTVLPVRELKAFFRSLSKVIPVQKLVEFTVEANPATVFGDQAEVLVDAGVTRVSLGAQSFFESELAVLDRLHTPEDIEPSVHTLRISGVGQISLDLLFGIPGQTLDTWAESLRRAIDLGVDHVACYSLTYEPGTPLAARLQGGEIKPCDEELEADMYLLAVDTLANAGYRQYEISHFARPGCQCRHNLIYWRNQPYIGVGPSAAGCDGLRRYKNVADVDGYIRMMDQRGNAEVESETLDPQALITEMIMMQLRLVEGLSMASFTSRTGFDPLALFDDSLKRLLSLGFVSVGETHIALTRKGQLVADAVIADLVFASGDRRVSLPTHGP